MEKCPEFVSTFHLFRGNLRESLNQYDSFLFSPSFCNDWHSGLRFSPNIVFILMDDFGYGDLGCYGGKDIKTPNLDRIAAEGLRFENFYSNAPVCTPTRCAFITGRWQQRVGFEYAMGYGAENFVKQNGEWIRSTDFHSFGLAPTNPSIAKFLKSAGYSTGAFGKWHLGMKDEFNPLHHGFDEFFGEMLGHCDYYKHDYYDGTHALREGLKSVEHDGEYLTDLLNQRAVKFIQDHASKPFFLYVPHLAVHAPWQAPDKPDTPSLRKKTCTSAHERFIKRWSSASI